LVVVDVDGTPSGVVVVDDDGNPEDDGVVVDDDGANDDDTDEDAGDDDDNIADCTSCVAIAKNVVFAFLSVDNCCWASFKLERASWILRFCNACWVVFKLLSTDCTVPCNGARLDDAAGGSDTPPLEDDGVVVDDDGANDDDTDEDAGDDDDNIADCTSCVAIAKNVVFAFLSVDNCCWASFKSKNASWILRFCNACWVVFKLLSTDCTVPCNPEIMRSRVWMWNANAG
jgi:hypothetical protein